MKQANFREPAPIDGVTILPGNQCIVGAIRSKDEFVSRLKVSTEKSNGQHAITVCGYQLIGWRLIMGRWRQGNVYYGRKPKVFR
jgi:hypothetical protein